MDPDSDGGNASSSAAAAAFASTTLQRLVAQSLPAGTLVVPDALNVMNQCASEFLRSLSAHLAAVAGDKSITPAMIDTALEQMGFDDYAEGSAKATAAAAAAKPAKAKRQKKASSAAELAELQAEQEALLEAARKQVYGD